MADGSIRIQGISDPPDRAHMLNRIEKGGSLCGVPYEELLRHDWIDTTPEGNFAGWGTVPPEICHTKEEIEKRVGAEIMRRAEPVLGGITPPDSH